ncbi:hypothetical protein V1503_18855 [Bacillus sp. SCS-151]|uniref:hypothetical protein n=1 Tax=Nanhaiella sioensis TaxID=3115293 RepID=UPI00397CCFE2
MANNTELRASAIRKKAKEVNQKETYEFEDSTTLTFYPIFTEKKIEKLLEEFASLFKQANEKDIELSDKMTYYLTLLQCIKHFTHLGKDIQNNLEYQLDYLDALIDSGYFKKITEEVFVPQEIQKVFERMTDVLGKYKMMEDLMNDAQNKFYDLKLKNKEVFEQLGNIGEKSKLVQ